MSRLILPSTVKTPRLLVLDPIGMMLDDRAAERAYATADDLVDQAAEAALSGHPKRAGYLEYWAGRYADQAHALSTQTVRATVGSALRAIGVLR